MSELCQYGIFQLCDSGASFSRQSSTPIGYCCTGLFGDMLAYPEYRIGLLGNNPSVSVVWILVFTFSLILNNAESSMLCSVTL